MKTLLMTVGIAFIVGLWVGFLAFYEQPVVVLTQAQKEKDKIAREVGTASAQELKSPDAVVSISDAGCRAFLAQTKDKKDGTAQVKFCKKQLGEKQL